MMQVTHNVACLARWMAADLYLREVDVLRFEVTIYTILHGTSSVISCFIPYQSCANVLQAIALGHSFCAAYFAHRSDPFVPCLPMAFIC